MRWCFVLCLTFIVVAGIASDGSAQIFGSRKPKTPPQQRVPELLSTLTADKSDHKRADAAEELRQFDPKDFPEIVPALIDALQNDPSASVRIEAAIGLGRLRPVAGPAGQALERAAANDSNLRVRIQAKASLVYYQMSGYHAPKKGDAPPSATTPTTQEPPLATSKEEWWQNVPPATPTVYRQMPTGPQVPVVTEPPKTSPANQVPSRSTDAPPQQPPTWTPAGASESSGPRLMPPG
jgi:hypothetical protein